MWRRGIGLAALVAALAAPAGGQAPPVGTLTFAVSGTPPAALTDQAPMAAGMTPTFRLTLGSDGTRLATHAELIADPASPQMAVLAGARLMAAWRFDADSVSVALSVPDAMRPLLSSLLASGAAPPPLGYHMTIKLPDVESVIKEHADKIDDDAADDLTATALGTRSTAGGIDCEEWKITSPRDTMTVCTVESSAPSMALVEWFIQRTDTRGAADDMTKRLFGGRKLTPIRAVAANGSFRMELEGASAASPPAAFFAIPAGFRAIDAADLPFGTDGS